MHSVSDSDANYKSTAGKDDRGAWHRRPDRRGLAVRLPLELFEDYYPRDAEGSPGCPDFLMVADAKNKGTKHPQATTPPTPGGQR